MQKLTRRHFLKGTIATASVALAGSRVLGANEDLRVAIVGFNGRGKDHIDGFHKQSGVRIVALCDVDQDVLAREAKKLNKVDTFTDVRKLLERKDIDIISTATPNHWHALISIWACQAGKDVYVEKPVSHNVWEGRKIVEAARKYDRIVQTGTQCRSSTAIQRAVEFVRAGSLGKVKLVRGLCYKRRPSIGKTTGPQQPPASVDYDLWTGPAPLEPLMRTRLHYDWHWQWPTGNGDLGNQGIHQMDIARWMVGANDLSPKIMSIGGRFGYEDDGQTPNTLMVMHEYENVPLFFEVRGLPHKAPPPDAKLNDKSANEMDTFRGASIGVIVHCEGGYVSIPSYKDAHVFDVSGAKIKSFDGDGDHYANFIKAVRSRKSSDLHADILEGHLSSSLCHTANISYRLGQSQPQAEVQEAIKADSEATETFGRMRQHLEVNGVKTDTPIRLGAWLKMDPKTERFIDNDKANEMLTREYRKPFAVPETV